MFKRFWWVFLMMAAIGPVIGFMMATVITYVMPKKYESEAVLEVRPRATANSSSPGGLSPIGTPMTPQFFATEFEVIKSRNSLLKVVEALELTDRWSMDRESTLKVLKPMISTTNIRGTDLISIRVRCPYKLDAKDIAEEVAKAYKAYRAEAENRDADLALRELNKVVKEQEDKVEDRRKALATIHPDVEDKHPSNTDYHDYNDAKRDLETDKQLLQQLKIKQVDETISAKMPSDRILIHDPPVIAETPVSPNVTLNLTLGTVCGLLFSPLLALPLAWLLNRRVS